MCADKITQGENNSRPKITQGIFKITQGVYGKKLKVSEVFCLMRPEKLFKKRQIFGFLDNRGPKMAEIDIVSIVNINKVKNFEWKVSISGK